MFLVCILIIYKFEIQKMSDGDRLTFLWRLNLESLKQNSNRWNKKWYNINNNDK